MFSSNSSSRVLGLLLKSLQIRFSTVKTPRYRSARLRHVSPNTPKSKIIQHLARRAACMLVTVEVGSSYVNLLLFLLLHLLLLFGIRCWLLVAEQSVAPSINLWESRCRMAVNTVTYVTFGCLLGE